MTEPLNLHEYETLARQKLTTMIYDYYASGADDAVTLRENREAFNRIHLLPRMLAGVGERDSSVTLFGQPLVAPIVVAPMAFIKMGHEDGELGAARAVKARGLAMTLSTMSNTSLEEVAEAAPAARWFQLYVYKDRGVTRQLVQRAEAAGYTALVLTVDTPLLGNREADRRNAFHLPPGLIAANLMRDEMQTVEETGAGESGLAAYIASLWDSNLTWAEVEWLRSITRLPVVVKGVLHPEDAELAIQHGAGGIIVSNHGGRQLDTVPAPITVLPRIVEQVAGRVPLVLDGGVRRGTDILKALAYGAQAVMVGRPILWGLAVDGENGAGHVLDLLMQEFDLALALVGCRRAADLNADLIYQR